MYVVCRKITEGNFSGENKIRAKWPCKNIFMHSKTKNKEFTYQWYGPVCVAIHQQNIKNIM